MENNSSDRKEGTELRIAIYVCIFAIGYLFYRSAHSSGYATGFGAGANFGNITGFGAGYEHGARVGYEEARVNGDRREYGYDLSDYARQARENEKGSSEREGSARTDAADSSSRITVNQSEEGRRD